MQIRHDTELLPYNTFALPARAETLIDIHHSADLPILLQQASVQQKPKTILGGGSNLILTQDIPGYLLALRNLGIEVKYEDDDYIFWKIEAGEIWHTVVQRSLAQGYSGLENLSLIPGTAGAAPIQNIGAYGVELERVFIECEAVDLLTGHIKTFSRADCRFGYRESIFKQATDAQWLITSITLRLNKKPLLTTHYGELKSLAYEYQEQQKILTPTLLSEKICEIRQAKLPDPKKLPNVGSFFKNPMIDVDHLEQLKKRWPQIISYPVNHSASQVKVAAGWLLEQLGWKGYRQGALGFHQQQALVMVNYGGATGQQVMALAHQVQAQVKQETGINLTIEPRIL